MIDLQQLFAYHSNQTDLLEHASNNYKTIILQPHSTLSVYTHFLHTICGTTIPRMQQLFSHDPTKTELFK